MREGGRRWRYEGGGEGGMREEGEGWRYEELLLRGMVECI